MPFGPDPQRRSASTPFRERLLWLVDGDLARLPPTNRARLVAWQEARTRIALGHLFSLLALVAACKVVLVLAGAWRTELSPWVYALALACVAGGRAGYHYARSLASEGLSATVFLLALLGILMDAGRHWAQTPGLAIGWVCLLAALGIPVLARLRSVVVFACVLVAALALFFARVPIPANQRLGVELYLLASIAGGVLLRRLRSDMSLDFRRTADEAIETANTDPLTGLANRRGWREQAPLLLERCGEDEDCKLIAADIVAERRGAFRILLDARQHESDRRQRDTARHHKADEEECGNKLVARPRS